MFFLDWPSLIFISQIFSSMSMLSSFLPSEEQSSLMESIEKESSSLTSTMLSLGSSSFSSVSSLICFIDSRTTGPELISIDSNCNVLVSHLYSSSFAPRFNFDRSNFLFLSKFTVFILPSDFRVAGGASKLASIHLLNELLKCLLNSMAPTKTFSSAKYLYRGGQMETLEMLLKIPSFLRNSGSQSLCSSSSSSMVLPLTCEYLYLRMAMVMLSSTYSQKKMISREQSTDTTLQHFCRLIMIQDQPSRVRVWNTDSIDHRNVSKLLMEKLGLEIPRPHRQPSLQVPLPQLHMVSVTVPVASSMQRFLSTPEKSWVPAMENTMMTKKRIYRESITSEKEQKSVETIIFNALTLVIVFSGLSTLMALSELTEKPSLTMKGSREVTTITKSSMFHRSRRQAFSLKTNPQAHIFRDISRVQSTMKVFSIVGLESSEVRGSSNAILTEFSTMMIRMKDSNRLCSTMALQMIEILLKKSRPSLITARAPSSPISSIFSTSLSSLTMMELLLCPLPLLFTTS